MVPNVTDTSSKLLPTLCQRQGLVPQYAIKTLPANLYVKCSSIPKAGRGVFAKQTIVKNTRFGPYVGKRIPMNNIKGDGSLLHVGGMFLFFRSIGILIVV